MHSQRRPAWLCPAAALGLALAAVTVLWQYWVPVPAGQDQSCYFGMARLLAETGTVRYAAFVDGETTGSFWINNGRDEIWPVYAPGYPLLLAAARRVGGPGSEYWVTPIAFFLLILAVFALARRFLPAWWALLATFLFAVSPALFLNAQLQNTHVVGCLLTVGALWLAVARVAPAHPFARVARPPAGARLAAAALCGLLLGCGAATRYPEALLLLAPPALWLPPRGGPRQAGGRLSLLLAYAAGAAVPLVALGWYQTAAFGAPWRTGYAFFNAAAGGFSWRYLPRTLLVYLPGLVTCGFGPACALFLLWLAPGRPGRHGRRAGRWPGRAFWLAWLLPLPVLYHFYFWVAPDSMHLSMRFWLSVFPGFAILGVLALRRLMKRHFWDRPGGLSRRGRWATGALIAAQGAWAAQFAAPAAENNALYAAMAARQAAFLRATVPEGAWVIFHHADLERDRDVFAEALFGTNHCHLFSSQLLAPGGLQRRAAEDLAARADGAPNTQQDDRARVLAARGPEELRAGFLARLRAAAAAGMPLCFFGNLRSAPGFMRAHQDLFAYGEPQVGEYIVPACVMFPQKRRQHNAEDRPVNVYPPLALVPLTLKDSGAGEGLAIKRGEGATTSDKSDHRDERDVGGAQGSAPAPEGGRR